MGRRLSLPGWFLELCFREALGNVGSPVRPRAFPKPPEHFVTDGSGDGHYLKLERFTREPKRKGNVDHLCTGDQRGSAWGAKR